MTTTADTVFDRTTALWPISTGHFDAMLDESWSSLTGVLGGYLTAHVVRAVEHVEPERAVRNLSVSFLRPTSPGPAELRVTPIRIGRSVGVHRVSLEQDGRETLHARVTTAATPPTEAVDWSTDPFELPPAPEQCEPIAPPETIRHFDHAIAVLDPTWTPFTGRPRALVAGWVRPVEPRPIDASWLAMILDWFPPAAFARAFPPVGGRSVDYTVHLHRTAPTMRRDDTDWLAGTFRADTAVDGLALEHGVIATADGTILAESFHTRIT